MSRRAAGAALVVAAVLAPAPAAWAAQERATATVRTKTTLHARCDDASPARMPLAGGDELEVEALVEGWARVRELRTGERGCVRRSALENLRAGTVGGGGTARAPAPTPRGGATGAAAVPATQPTGAAAARPATPGRPVRLAAFGYGGRLTLSATKSFDAILGSASGTVAGGGAQVALLSGPLRHLFVQVDVSRFEETGERVFVSNGEVFELGIPTTLTLLPVEVTLGYRYPFAHKARDGRRRPSPFVPYGGAGVGSVRFEEVSSFAEPAENVAERFTSYHVLGGLEVAIWRGFGAGLEGHYRWVPDGLGRGGVSQEFNETDLGGATVRVKVGFAF